MVTHVRASVLLSEVSEDLLEGVTVLVEDETSVGSYDLVPCFLEEELALPTFTPSLGHNVLVASSEP